MMDRIRATDNGLAHKQEHYRWLRDALFLLQEASGILFGAPNTGEEPWERAKAGWLEEYEKLRGDEAQPKPPHGFEIGPPPDKLPRADHTCHHSACPEHGREGEADIICNCGGPWECDVCDEPAPPGEWQDGGKSWEGDPDV